MARRAAGALAAAGLAWAAGAQEALYFIDAARVICDKTPLTIDIDIPSSSAARAKIHVPSFFRTFYEGASVRWGLSDAAGNAIVPAGTQTNLQPHGRRLDDQAGLCEEFFLSDGRSPAELPDTWEEAHDAFLNICGDNSDSEGCDAAGEQLFLRRPSGSEVFEPAGDFCADLARYHEDHLGGIGMGRRLKGGTGTYSSSGGSPAVGGWQSSTRSGMSDYGYTTARMGSAYPGGYATTAYGYSGRGARAPWRTATTVAVVGGVGVFSGYSMWRWSHYGAGGRPSDCSSSESDCGWKPDGREFVRDDIMTFGALLSQMAYPLKLRIEELSSPALKLEFLCRAPENVSTAPGGGDLFFSLVEVDELEEDEGDDGEFGGLAALFLVVACCCGWSCCFRQKARQYFAYRKLRKQREEAGQVSGAPTYLGASHLTFAATSTRQEVSNDMVYELSITEDGVLSGCCRHSGGQTRDVIGKVAGWDGDAFLLLWHEGHPVPDRTFEFRGTFSVSSRLLTGSWLSAREKACHPQGTMMWGDLRAVSSPGGSAEGVPSPQGSIGLPVVVGRPVEGEGGGKEDAQ